MSIPLLASAMGAALPAVAPHGADVARDLLLEHAAAFRDADGVAENVAAAAHAVGYDVAPVALPDINDPLALLVWAVSEARVLQAQAIARMTSEDWTVAQAGAEAALRLVEPIPVAEREDGGPAVRVHPEVWPEVEAGLVALDVDRAGLWQATYLLATAMDQAAQLARAPDFNPASQTLPTPWGAATLVGGCGNDLYSAPQPVIIDLCGDDWYTGGAGGASGLSQTPISVVLDLGGNDMHDEWGLTNFAAATTAGIAIAWDDEGVDAYGMGFGSDIAGGGELAGIGVLLETATLSGYSPDTYRVSGFLQPGKVGGGFFGGAGVLVDTVGDDVRTGDTYEQGSGWFLGAGILVDGGGNDYTFDLSTFAQGSGGVGGLGLLIDVGGHDQYSTVSPYEQGAGGCGGAGALVDVMGNDWYDAPWRSQGFGGVGLFDIGCAGEAGELPGIGPLASKGVLMDLEGWDTYSLSFGVYGQGSGDTGLGLLIDVGAQWDLYWSFNPPINGGIRPDGALGLAVDV